MTMTAFPVANATTEAETESGIVTCRSGLANDTISNISVREMTAWSVAAASIVLCIGSLIIILALLCISRRKKRQSKVKDPANTIDNTDPHIYDLASNDLRKLNGKDAPVYENMKQMRYK